MGVLHGNFYPVQQPSYRNIFQDQYKSQWKTDEALLILACYNGGIGNIMKAKFDPRIIKKKMPKTYDYMTRGSNLLGIAH